MFDTRSAQCEILKIAPTTLMLILGLAVCFQQRRRRPKVSRYLAIAIILDLCRETLTFHAAHTLFPRLSNGNLANTVLRNTDVYPLREFLSLLLRCVTNILFAATWAIVIWTILRVKDREMAKKEPSVALSAESPETSSGIE